MLNQQNLAHELLTEIVNPDDVVVDATMGNGYDTLFLTGLSKHVFAFDVQEAALIATKRRLQKMGKSATLILDGHENLMKYVKIPVKAAIFNLGYLPQTDKTVVTQAETTLTALSDLTKLLVRGGRVTLMIYSGHEGGMSEKKAVLSWVSTLPQSEWNVFSFTPLNQIHTPPILVCLEKR